MSEHRYVHSAEKDDVELERLRRQGDVYDPVTVRHLEAIGVSRGWKCLEVGAGTGSIAQWLASRVGPTGKVVATDIDSRFLNRLKTSNLEVRRHDILNDELEKDVYDLVHCRLVLHHLPDPEKAARRLADANRPGGWLLIGDDDWGSVLSVDVTDPRAVPFTKAARAVWDSVRKSGAMDVYYGRRMLALVEQLGYVDVGQEGVTGIMRGGDRWAHETVESWSGVLKPFVLTVLTQEQFEGVLRLLMDPTFYSPFGTLYYAWGRKPEAERRS